MGSQPGKRSGGHKVIVASECQPPARPGGRGSWGCHQGGCPRSGMGSEGIQDSSGYLPEVLTVVADTAGTACPPGIQPCQSDQPRVQLVAHSWAETTPVGSQHLWAPRASGPENGTCVSGIAMRTAPPIHTHSLQSCHHQSPGPPVFRNDLEAATTRAPPAAHSPQHRVPTQEEERGWEG